MMFLLYWQKWESREGACTYCRGKKRGEVKNSVLTVDAIYSFDSDLETSYSTKINNLIGLNFSTCEILVKSAC